MPSRFHQEKKYFLENLSTLVGAGLNIEPALATMQAEFKSKRMRLAVAEIHDDIESGSALWRSLERTKLFSGYILSLIKIGEQAGRLSENLKVIVDTQQKSEAFGAKIRSALLYPIIVFVITVVVGVGTAWFILPKLAGVFSELDIELPVLTKILIQVGEFLGKYGIVVAPLFLFCVAALIYGGFFFPPIKHAIQAFVLRVPGVRRLIQGVELARGGFIMGTLLEAGLPITDAMQSLADSTEIKSYKKFYLYMYESISDGTSFKRSFAGFEKISKLIPSTIQTLMVTAEESGTLAETCKKIGKMYDEKTDISAKSFAVAIEPILLVVVWLGVLLVALSVILPIYSLIGQLNP